MGQSSIENWEMFLENSLKNFNEKYKKKSESKLKPTDFNFVRTVGVGSFGRVVLVKRKVNAHQFAIKILEKEKILRYGQLEHTLNEKRILQSIDFKFIVKMEDFFKDCCYLYIVMPYARGGDIFTILRKVKRLTEDACKFYAAQVLLALEYLHYLRIVYRDLKPENLLLEDDGYLKLTDLGFSKIIKTRTYTMCGTPEYIAPEVVSCNGYGFAVDWWALGVLIYEMCVGCSPFASSDEIVLFTSITEGHYNSYLLASADIKNIVKSLLQVSPSKRLGNLANGVSDIKRHSWFKNIVWLDILNKRVKPPIRLNLSGSGNSSLYGKYVYEQMKRTPEVLFEEEFAQF